MSDTEESKIQISSDRNISPYSSQLIRRGVDLLSKIQDRTIRVPQDFSSLEEAVEKANEGETIEISDGTYFVTLNINKGINIRGKKGDIITLRPKYDYIAKLSTPIGDTSFDNIYFDGKPSDKKVNLPNPECIRIVTGNVNFINCFFDNFEQDDYLNFLIENHRDDEYEPCNCIIVKSDKSKLHLDHCVFGKSCDIGIWFESNNNVVTLDNNVINATIYLSNNCQVTSHHNYFNSGSFACEKNSVLLSSYDTFQSDVLINSSSKCLANFVHSTIIVGSLFLHIIGREFINPDVNPAWTQGKPEVNITDSIVIVKELVGEFRFAPSAQSIQNLDLSLLSNPFKTGLVKFFGNNLIKIPQHFNSPDPKLKFQTNEIQLEPDSPAMKSASDGLNIGAWQLL